MQYLDLDIDFRHLYMYGSCLCLLLYTLFVYGIPKNVKGIKTFFVELIKMFLRLYTVYVRLPMTVYCCHHPITSVVLEKLTDILLKYHTTKIVKVPKPLTV